MTGFAFTWHGLRLEARCSGALWWPGERWLIVADLHLGKSERMARRGGALLPPYEAEDTLRRLRDETAALDPRVASLCDAVSGQLDEADLAGLRHALVADASAWRSAYGANRDVTALACERNVLRYRPTDVLVRAGAGSVAVPRTVMSETSGANAIGPASPAAQASASFSLNAINMVVPREGRRGAVMTDPPCRV